MDLQKFFELEQAPVRFHSHPAVQRDIVLSSVVTKENDELAREATETAQKLSESINYRLLPLYLKTNLSVRSNWAGLYTIPVTDVELDNHFDQYKWMYQFLQQHAEVEKVALVTNLNVLMKHNPFPDVEPNRIYVADELGNLQKIIDESQQLPEVTEFLRDNSNLQILNDSVIVGTRAIILEFLGALLSYRNQEDADSNSLFSEIGLFNYLIYRYFSNRVVHGRKVSSIIGFQQVDTTAWFKCD